MADLEELLAFRRELQQEETLLVKMLKTIDEQLHALQVEQLQLLNASAPAPKQATATSSSSDAVPVAEMQTKVQQELDLTIPNSLQHCEEEEDEEENDESILP